jgi:hypothetical protein
MTLAQLPPRARARAPAALLMIAALTVGGLLAAPVALPATLALFTAQGEVQAQIGAARIFRGERATPAFSVSDVSSGSAVNASSPIAFAADGLHMVTRAWPDSAAADRYLEADFNGPLPAGLAVPGAQLNLRFAADSAGATACVQVQLRRASTDGLLSSHGSPGSPLACVTGTSFSTTTVPLPAVDGSDLANDVRVRIIATSTATGPIRIDTLTVGGSTPHAGFTLYAVRTREVDGGNVELRRWGLAG